MLAANPPIPELTPRQKKILEAMTRGLTDRDIATLLGIRLDGVYDHVSAILHKAIALRKHLV